MSWCAFCKKQKWYGDVYFRLESRCDQSSKAIKDLEHTMNVTYSPETKKDIEYNFTLNCKLFIYSPRNTATLPINYCKFL